MLACQKHHFSLPEDQHYLNCAYMSPLARRVEAAGLVGMRRKRNPAAISSEDFFTEAEQARSLFARLIQGETERVALIPSASYGLATVAQNLKLERGQNIVMVHEQFPSNVYIWQRLAESMGATIRMARPPDNVVERNRWNEHILDAIDAETALVTLGCVHWADGTLFDLRLIGEKAREVEAAFVIDGTQSIGALPFELSTIRPDAVICAGYKWLLAPYSIGCAYFGPRFDVGTPLEENWIARLHSEKFGGLVTYQPAYQPGSVRYDVGERANFILVPMLVAALELIHAWGVDQIQAYCANLTQKFIQEVRNLGFTVADSRHRSAHLFGIRVPSGLSMNRIAQALQVRQVSISTRGDALRVAPHVYNDANDMDALYDALRTVMQSRSDRFQS